MLSSASVVFNKFSTYFLKNLLKFHCTARTVTILCQFIASNTTKQATVFTITCFNFIYTVLLRINRLKCNITLKQSKVVVLSPSYFPPFTKLFDIFPVNGIYFFERFSFLQSSSRCFSNNASSVGISAQSFVHVER